MDAIQLSQLWTAGAVLAGFHMTALTWRISREVAMEAEDEETWTTLADGIVAASFLILVIGVFIAPLSGTASTVMAAKLLAISLMVFACAPFVLAGHYNLYCAWGKCAIRSRVTKQECASVVISTVAVGCGTWWILG